MDRVLPVRAHAQWLLESLETMPETKRNAAMKPRTGTKHAEKHNGDILDEAIRLRWKAKKKKIGDLAQQSGCDYTTLRGYIKNGFDETPAILSTVCILLGIDKDALSQGRIEDAKPQQLEQEAVSVLREIFRLGKGDEALDHLKFVRDRVSRHR